MEYDTALKLLNFLNTFGDKVILSQYDTSNHHENNQKKSIPTKTHFSDYDKLRAIKGGAQHEMFRLQRN